MKKISVFLVVSMMLTMFCSFAVMAEEDEAAAAYGTPVIDGKIDAVWDTAAVNPVALLKDGTDTGVTASWRGLWDEKFFYVLIEVQDDAHHFEGDISYGDGVEVYLDPLLLEADSFNEENVGYFGLKANDPYTLSISTLSGAEILLEDILTIEVREEKDGYLYEIAMELPEFTPDIKMAAGTRIGFEIQVNDKADGSDSRTAAYGWADEANAAWQYPYVLGRVTFAEPAEAPVSEAPVSEASVTDAPVPEETAAPAVEEPAAPVPEEPESSAETEATAAPQTGDKGKWLAVLLAVSVLLPAAGFAVSAKKDKFS